MNDRYYCFPDIHGNLKLLYAALHYVYSINTSGGKIIFLGDYIDRGPDNLGVLKLVMSPPENWEFICLAGNHEEMYMDAFSPYHKPFYDKVAAAQIAGIKDEAYYSEIRENTPPEILDWMTKLKLFHFEDNNIFAHANYDAFSLPERQSKSNLLWARHSDSEPYESHQNSLHLTHGHTPRKNGPISSPNRTNLDCGVVAYNRFVIGEYEKGVTGPVQFLEFE